MNLSPHQSRYLVTLRPGEAAVFADGMDNPVLVEVPDSTAREAAPSRTRSAAELIAEHGTVCPDCTAAPCSLRQLTSVRHQLARDRRLTIWAELTVVAHLVGMPPPARPKAVSCVLHHAVADSVGARSAVLAGSHSPAEFISHLAGSKPSPVDRWLAPCYRWNPARLALKALLAQNPEAGRHPDSARWESSAGVSIPGVTAQEQSDVLRRWSQRLLRNQAVVRETLHGAGRPSILETAVGCADDAPEWPALLYEATADFSIPGNWVPAFLIPRRK